MRVRVTVTVTVTVTVRVRVRVRVSAGLVAYWVEVRASKIPNSNPFALARALVRRAYRGRTVEAPAA